MFESVSWMFQRMYPFINMTRTLKRCRGIEFCGAGQNFSKNSRFLRKSAGIALLFLAVILVGTTPAIAQYRGQTAFALGPALVFPTESSADVGAGIHGEFEYYLSHRWSLGLDTALQWSEGGGNKLNHAYLGLLVGFHFDLGKWHPLFEGGVALYRVEEKKPRRGTEKETSIGGHFGIGLEYFLRPTTSVRFMIEGHDIFSDLKGSFIATTLTFRFYF